MDISIFNKVTTTGDNGEIIGRRRDKANTKGDKNDSKYTLQGDNGIYEHDERSPDKGFWNVQESGKRIQNWREGGKNLRD
jgi:hypothetical protein